MAHRLSLTDEIYLGDAFDVFDQNNEQHSFVIHTQPRWTEQPPRSTPVFNKIVTIINLLLSVVLALSLALVAHSTTERCHQALEHFAQPYSPALEALVPIKQRFKPVMIFQSETSDEVEAAWAALQGPSHGVIFLTPEESAKLSKISYASIPSDPLPVKHIWGASMYLQLDCLDILRRSFYREKFFPNITNETFNFQKNVCFDYLRQTIQCHGDMSLTYMGNNTVENGKQNRYKSQEAMSRARAGSAFWDAEHFCQAPGANGDWARPHQPRRTGEQQSL